MNLPDFTPEGDLPPGVHRVTMEDVLRRFGSGTAARQRTADALKQILHLARSTNRLNRIVIFGSFVTAKAMPNDVDVVLVMDDRFRLEMCDHARLAVFDHERAQREIGQRILDSPWTVNC